MMASSGGTLLDLEETSFLVFECIPLSIAGNGMAWRSNNKKPEMEEEEEEDVCI